MLRALSKAAALFAFGRAPGGPALYRALTRGVLGTYATAVDKQARVWPGYIRQWTERAGLRLQGAELWVHGAGETPFATLAMYLLSGSGGVVTNPHAGFLPRYIAGAVDGALAAELAPEARDPSRRAQVRSLRSARTVEELLRALGGAMHAHVAPERVPLQSGSRALCHSGGELEHYTPAELDAFLAECRRVLRPGGLASHIVDHRDHLHHADRRLPFLAHLALPEGAYDTLFRHALGYHSRLTPTQVAERFERAGFERIALRRMRYPERQYVEDAAILQGAPGLPRRALARAHRGISEEDLRTAAAHYVYRRR